MNKLFTVAIVSMTVAIINMDMVNCGVRVVADSNCINTNTGDIPYDTQTQLCCNGQVYDKNPDFYQDCCGEAGPFNVETQQCCGNQIIPRNSELECCTNYDDKHQSYNTTTHICCGSDIHEKHGDEVRCCGEHPMQTKSQTCCPSGRSFAPRDGLGQCCGLDKIFLPQTQLCCATGYPLESRIHSIGRLQQDEIQCCGTDFYLHSAQICCNGVVHDRARDSHTSCCGDQTYDTLNQVCCGDTVSDIVNGTSECCGNTPYNPTVQQCCLFKVSPIANGKCCSNQAYHPSESSCCNGKIHHGVPEIEGVQRCCDQVAYLETQQICCNKQLYDQQKDVNCCDKNLYNTTTQLCCENAIVPKKTSASHCCGSGVYESDTETCCEAADTGFPGLGRQCCRTHGDGVVPYDPAEDTCCTYNQWGRYYEDTPESDAQCCRRHLVDTNQLCDGYNGRVVDKTHPDDDEICRTPYSRAAVTYNSRTQVCTSRGTVMMKGSPQEQICGGRLYDPETQICCQGMVHSKYDEAGYVKVCCQPGVQAYVSELQMCCAGRVKDIHPNVGRCCRNLPYDTTLNTCDQNDLVRPIEEVQRYPNMCGNEPYHPDNHSCCYGDLLVGHGQTCCNYFIFNTNTSGINTGECCGGLVGYNPNMEICCGVHLYPKANEAVTCCSDKFWDPSTSEYICCEGILQDIQSIYGPREHCSGQMAYNIDMETVCDGVRYQQGHKHCCGKQTFDPEQEICCNEHVYPKTTVDTQCCGTLPYIPSDLSTLCCDGATLHHNAQRKQCCGSHAIDIHQRQCCTISDHPYAYKTSQNTCCSSNTAQDTCCHGNLHLNIKDGDCCGSAVIRNPDHEMCCDGVKVRKEYGRNSVCCGSIVIDSRLSTCCNGRKLHNQFQGCCNNQVFSKYAQACCGTEIYSIHSKRMCCNDTLHDSDVYGCCKQQPYTKGKHGCCAGGVFDAANQVCQAGKIGNRERRQTTLAESPLCDGHPYNPEDEGCCGRALYSKSELGCCNGETYNPQNAVCCGNKISYVKNGACCGERNKPYNSGKRICCNGALRVRLDSSTECCGRKAYQNDTQICCDTKLYNRDSELDLQCCGRHAYSPDYEICCTNDNVVDSTSSYVTPSCYTRVYDTVSAATVWVQKMFGPNKKKGYKKKRNLI